METPNHTAPPVAADRRVRRWSRHTVNISPAGDVTLRTPSGRTTGWFGGSRKDPDAAAVEWLETFPGATLVDKRKFRLPTAAKERRGLANQP